jgi:uncharacterized protein (TIGR01244 family)
MQTIRKITSDLSVAGQIELADLPQIPQIGFKSLLNLRSTDEQGYLLEEEGEARLLGLEYAHSPVTVRSLIQRNVEHLSQALLELGLLPKPALVHCDSATRSAALVLIYIATQQGTSLTQALQQVAQLNLFAEPAPL